MRHLDVNVLWLQETCARRDIPLHKTPGEDNPADLMTKHIGAAKIDQHVKKMNMEYKSGRSGKAAQLHSLETREARDMWKSIMKTGHELRGGDRWIMKGERGVWYRAHTTPRLAKFTPYKVPKGPSSKLALSNIRFNFGVTGGGRRFEFHDNWSTPEERHKHLEEPWVGYTLFVEQGTSNSIGQELRQDIEAQIAGGSRRLGVGSQVKSEGEQARSSEGEQSRSWSEW